MVILSGKKHPGSRITWYNKVILYCIELCVQRVVHDGEQMHEQFEPMLDELTQVVSISPVYRRTEHRLSERTLVEVALYCGIPLLLDWPRPKLPFFLILASWTATSTPSAATSRS